MVILQHPNPKLAFVVSLIMHHIYIFIFINLCFNLGTFQKKPGKTTISDSEDGEKTMIVEGREPRPELATRQVCGLFFGRAQGFRYPKWFVQSVPCKKLKRPVAVSLDIRKNVRKPVMFNPKKKRYDTWFCSSQVKGSDLCPYRIHGTGRTECLQKWLNV